MPLTREQIDDLALLSREYERQEAARMLHDAGLGPMMSPTWEPYINEPIPVPENKQRKRPRKSRPTSCYDSYDSYRRR
ncbi:hypothetical protein VTN49DRAFT_5349 [Thermomyces lanuginosus]|uniref:uncharacterized protein n=1 Tax=Thermomyces lanuginosus TaxID=5541 RepID=UPI0037438FE7